MAEGYYALVHTAFLQTAEDVARGRPEVDVALAREVFEEAATRLHDGLALDWLDEHDARAVVAGLCDDLVAADPGAAIRAHAEEARQNTALHDPQAAAGAYLVAAQVLQL